MIPLGTNLRLKETPWATLGLLAVNWVVFILSRNVSWDTGFLIKHYLMATPGEQYPWTLVTSIFLHGNLFHILGNSLFLLVFGPPVEDKTGWKAYLFLYFLTGMAADLIHGLMAGLFLRDELFIPSLGASGAISGIMGVYLYRCYYSKIKLAVSIWLPIPVQIPAVIVMSLWFLKDFKGGIESITGITGNVAFWAHVGGFAAGFGACEYLRYETPARKERLAFVAENALSRYCGYGEGVEAGEKLLKDDPGNPQLHLDLARAKSRWRASPEAKDHYEQTIKLTLQKDLGKAGEIFVEYWRKYLSVLPAKEQVRLSLLLNRNGQVDLSAQTLQSLVDSGQPPDSYMEQAHLDLAGIYRKGLKRDDLARSVYEKFMQRFPRSEQAEFVRKVLGTLPLG